jgi:hypothetical protein
VRSYLVFSAFLFGCFAVVIGLADVFAAWWDLPDESMLAVHGRRERRASAASRPRSTGPGSSA